MGEMSDYFEDFPEENPANWDPSGNFNPRWREEAERQQTAFQQLDQKFGRTRPPARSQRSPTPREESE